MILCIFFHVFILFIYLFIFYFYLFFFYFLPYSLTFLFLSLFYSFFSCYQHTSLPSFILIIIIIIIIFFAFFLKPLRIFFYSIHDVFHFTFYNFNPFFILHFSSFLHPAAKNFHQPRFPLSPFIQQVPFFPSAIFASSFLLFSSYHHLEVIAIFSSNSYSSLLVHLFFSSLSTPLSKHYLYYCYIFSLMFLLFSLFFNFVPLHNQHYLLNKKKNITYISYYTFPFFFLSSISSSPRSPSEFSPDLFFPHFSSSSLPPSPSPVDSKLPRILSESQAENPAFGILSGKGEARSMSRVKTALSKCVRDD